MKKKLQKFILTAVFLCSAVSAAWADGWKLTSTTVYGNGGYWENGQKTRIDCSYKNGTFRYERKVSIGTKMDVYSSRAEFSEPQQSYSPGEDISVRIAFTEKGERQNYIPYARVTVMPRNPLWTKINNKASNKIPATGPVDGQAVDAGGRNAVTPPETVTLMANALTNGEQMAIVYSCNGMDVVYLYEWDGELVVTPTEEQPQSNEIIENEQIEEETPTVEETPAEEDTPNEEEKPVKEETPNGEETANEPPTHGETEPDDDHSIDSDEDSFPLAKLFIVIAVAALLFGLIIIAFRKKKDKTPAEAAAPTPNWPVCPNCGAPIEEDSRFCQECGHKLNP